MAEIQQKDDGGGKKGKQKKFNIHVDFTPMVDMNMLLITFFMLCTTMSKPQTMEISMPRKDVIEDEKEKIKASNAITVLLGKADKVYYYFGEPTYDDPDLLKETDFSGAGLRAVLLGRNQEVVEQMTELKKKRENLEVTLEQYKEQSIEIKKNKNSPVVLIKASDFSTYKNLIDALDEMQICNIGRYTIVDITDGDLRLLQDRTHDGYAPELEEKVIWKQKEE
jgi:biopolymer transport protein ExbD